MKIIVTTDSTSDLPQELQEKYNIGVMPLIVNLEDDTFEDGVNIHAEEIFAFVDKTGMLPKTAAKSSEAYEDFFKENLQKNNADMIIHISLSSELSSSYNNARLAAEELENVNVIDSLSLSTGCALLTLSAVDKILAEKDLNTIINELEEEKYKIQASFIINNLKYLHKGGRCSALTVLGANLLRIKPKIKVVNGKMDVDKKYMGKFDQVVINYVNDLIKEYPNANKKRVFITYTTKHENLIEQITNILSEQNFETILNNTAGSTISSHCGEDTIGVLFLCC